MTHPRLSPTPNGAVIIENQSWSGGGSGVLGPPGLVHAPHLPAVLPSPFDKDDQPSAASSVNKASTVNKRFSTYNQSPPDTPSLREQAFYVSVLQAGLLRRHGQWRVPHRDVPRQRLRGWHSSGMGRQLLPLQPSHQDSPVPAPAPPSHVHSSSSLCPRARSGRLTSVVGPCWTSFGRHSSRSCLRAAPAAMSPRPSSGDGRSRAV